jgi:hypothetical protein
MHRSRRLASALAATVLVAAQAPMAPLVPASAAGECGTHRSETDPPPTIRVLQTATGAVETVDFRTYLKNVLSREWISSWTTESLRSGAMAVKNYAWYQVIHWRGYTNAAGECFDIFDSTRDQHYDPGRPTYPAMAAAVDATWRTLAHRGGRIFATYYNAGAAHEACGANANGWQMFQWGTQACGLAGMPAAQILAVYYPGVAVTAMPPPVGPPPPTPMPDPTPPPPPASEPPPTAPATPPSAGPSAAPAPTPVPAPAPTSPPEPIAMPGGGQVGLVAPPAPPPLDPQPIIMSVAVEAEVPIVEVAAAGAPTITPPGGNVRTFRDHAVVRFEQAVDDEAARHSAPGHRTTLSLATRLLIVRLVVDRVAASLVSRRPP